jgi:diketogulonate reductase-like aldo/keto reductase
MCDPADFCLMNQVKQITKMQLKLWGIDYFDLFLVHFPVALKYVDPSHRYPPELFGDGGKVYTRKLWGTMGVSQINIILQKIPRCTRLEVQWRSLLTRSLRKILA